MSKAASVDACVIAKDEEQNIARCLESVKPWTRRQIVLDTGSSDATVRIARSLGAEVYRWRWNGSFADARNEALRHVSADWVLMPDADEELDQSTAPALARLTRSWKPCPRGYAVQIRSLDDHRADTPYLDSYAMRLFQRRPGVRFERAVHEQLAGPGLTITSTDEVRLIHYGYLIAALDRKRTL